MATDYTEKAGPLPVWAWGGILGAVLLGYMYFKRKTTGATGVGSTGVAQAAAATTAPLNLAGITTNGIPAASLSGYSGPPSTATTSTAIGTNASWLAQGVSKAQDLAYTPLDAQTALQNYLTGQSITPTQANIVNKIVTSQGIPPQGVTSTPDIQASTPAAATPAPTPAAATPAPAAVWPATETDPRRLAIIGYYEDILGRVPGRSEVNAWDSTGATLPQIRAGIVNSKEALGR